MQKWREIVEESVRLIGGIGTLQDIYNKVETTASRELPTNWKAIVRRELEYNSRDSESFQGHYDLFYSVNGIGKGVWGLNELKPELVAAHDIEPPDRVEVNVNRIIRNTSLTNYLKLLHKDQCQLCGITLELANGKTYSEAHHIKPLGKPHNGPDISSNIIILCPNHHAQLDFGAFSLSHKEIVHSTGHIIDELFLEYHNNNIARE